MLNCSKLFKKLLDAKVSKNVRDESAKKFAFKFVNLVD